VKPCAWVENMVSIETDGWSRPCCGETGEAARISPASAGIRAAFNHPKLLELREHLNSTGYSEATDFACYRCRQVEESGQQSLRTSTQFLSDVREIRAIQFKMSNKCQLTCAHCGPDRSSGWRKLLGISPHVMNSFEVTDEFLAELVELLPTLDHIKFTGGEPFLDPAHYKILEHLANYDRSHCKLVYITNGLIKPRLDLWAGWRDIECSISIEGYGSRYEWFRRGANWLELQDSVEFIKQHSKTSISYSMTPWTFKDYHRTVEHWKLPVFPFPVVYPKHASLHLFPRMVAELHWDDTTPFFSLTAQRATGLGMYKQWAQDWDRKWNTPGLAEDLYPWLK